MNILKTRRGFAALPAWKQREIAQAGGRAAHASGRAHQFTSEEAKRAGRKGGKRSGEVRLQLRKATAILSAKY
ncbi:MAG: hypothetical protein COV10_01505 [Candidatus Vogelbacteria bacterium CG10_big_fil_rev_8_21_14_0_10_51_16]|uniref:General stress protein n=1 Tax=Candidatus Vogelbacteria bacterium CG10_big_fil_rev_8_21_14_0_10_51_16 TaxID=1975045 RepID=A0A2H0RG84_9BACT|nr:MAG: hypothetical protein COV10_01505 [Candidatus Vogelbacteria bacterium CG10_big_fil_rev_8_21_14_0_10_51_16]